MAMDGAVEVGGVIEDLSEAASGVGGDGGGVVTADMGVNLFQFQRLQGLCNELLGVSPATVIPVGLQAFQKVAVLPLLQPQSAHIDALFFPYTANAVREKVLAEKAVEVLTLIKGVKIIDLRQGKDLEVGNISCNDQHIISSRRGWTWWRRR